MAAGELAVSPAEDQKPAFALPGPYPGRVIEIHHSGSAHQGKVRPGPVKEMVDRGMMELTGASDAVAAWRTLFQKGDRVGLKVNPVGCPSTDNDFGIMSSFPVIGAIIEGLRRAGLTNKDILLFERYADQFRKAGYDRFLQREWPGVAWYASAFAYCDTQTDLAGLDVVAGKKADRDLHVLGYDRDVFQRFDFTHPDHDANDPLRHQSHVSRIVTGNLINKIINIPVLKDHSSAGVTLALKNISHGMVNNVCRSHVGPAKGLNRCAEFIPRVVALPALRRKIVLHILDGLIGQWQGGPSPGARPGLPGPIVRFCLPPTRWPWTTSAGASSMPNEPAAAGRPLPDRASTVRTAPARRNSTCANPNTSNWPGPQDWESSISPR